VIENQLHSVSYGLSVSENQTLSSQMSSCVLQIVSCEQSVNENQPPSCQMSPYVLHSVLWISPQGKHEQCRSLLLRNAAA
jgi:hypothetical protein